MRVLLDAVADGAEAGVVGRNGAAAHAADQLLLLGPVKPGKSGFRAGLAARARRTAGPAGPPERDRFHGPRRRSDPGRGGELRAAVARQLQPSAPAGSSSSPWPCPRAHAPAPTTATSWQSASPRSALRYASRWRNERAGGAVDRGRPRWLRGGDPWGHEGLPARHRAASIPVGCGRRISAARRQSDPAGALPRDRGRVRSRAR